MNMFLSETAGVIGLLFFFLIFTGIAVWAYWPENKERLEKYKFIPIRESDHE